MFSVYPFPCDDWENIYTLSYYHNQIGNMNYYPLFRVRSWNNGVRCMSFCILMESISEGSIVFNGIYELTMSCKDKLIYVLRCKHECYFFYFPFASKLVKYSIRYFEMHYSKTLRGQVIPLAINIMISITLVPYVASSKTNYVIQGGWGGRCRWIQLCTSDKCQGII